MARIVYIYWPPKVDQMVVTAPQHAFLASAAKLKLLCCGRFGGKTRLALTDSLDCSLKLFAQRTADATWYRPGPIVTVGIFAPTDENHVAIWNTLLGLLPEIPGEAADGLPNVFVRRSEYKVSLFGFLGIQIDLISCWLPDNILGSGYDIVFIDETARLKRPSIWTKIIKPLVIRAGYYGKVTIASTPLNNFFDRWALSALDSKGRMKRFEYFHWTSFDTPKLTEEELELILDDKEEDPAHYRQEYLAELFVEIPPEEVVPGEKVWQHANVEPCMVSDTIVCRGPYSVGVDLAWLGSDCLVVSVVDKPTDFCCHLEVYPKTTNQEIYDIVDRVDRQWNQPTIHFDRTGSKARAWAELLPPKYQIHPLVFRRSIDRNRHAEYVVSKDLLIRGMQQRMSLGRFRFPNPDEYDMSKLPWSNQQDQERNFRRLRDELLALNRKTIKKANGDEEYIYEADVRIDPETGKPVKSDDCIDGTLLALRGMPTIVNTGTTWEEVEEATLQNW